MNLSQLRADTPGCEERIHLNNAGAGLMPTPVIRAIQRHIELESRIGGYEAEAACEAEIADAYRAVADLLGAAPRNVAFTENATASYLAALSAIPFAPDDVILTTRNDYVSNQIQFLSLQRRFGVQVLRAPDRTAGGVDDVAMADMIERHRPRLVCVTQVPTSSGLVQDVAAVGAACRAHDVLYLVDACQSVGQMPVDPGALGADFLSATSRKFLRGPRGAGFLYVSDRVLERGLEPLFVDMRGADWIAPDRYRQVEDARRFENWEFAWALVLGTGAAARYALDVGVETIRDRARGLATRLRAGLAALPGVRVLDRGPELSALVTLWVDRHEPDVLASALRERGINSTAQTRAAAVLHYDERGVTGALRLSPHYYNTEDEVDRATTTIGELAGA